MTGLLPLELAEEVPSVLLPMAKVKKENLCVLISIHKCNTKMYKFYPDIPFSSLNIPTIILFV